MTKAIILKIPMAIVVYLGAQSISAQNAIEFRHPFPNYVSETFEMLCGGHLLRVTAGYSRDQPLYALREISIDGQAISAKEMAKIAQNLESHQELKIVSFSRCEETSDRLAAIRAQVWNPKPPPRSGDLMIWLSEDGSISSIEREAN